MLVSRDKYNAVLAERDQFQARIDELTKDLGVRSEALKQALESNDALQSSVDQLQESLAQANSGELQAEIDRLSAEVQRLTTELQQANELADSRQQQINELQTSLEQSQQRESDLRQAVERLNNEGASPGATISKSSDSQQVDVNEFVKANRHDTAACIQYLRKQGF